MQYHVALETSKYPSPYEHIVQAQQFDREFLKNLFKLADRMRENPRKYSGHLQNNIFAMLFFEPSTRTRMSFESAAHQLGGMISASDNAGEVSSAVKGESVYDTIMTISYTADYIIMRHKEDSAWKDAVRALRDSSSWRKKSLINAGCGKDQHPTQGLLDLYTIWKNFKRLDNLRVALVGDLAHGRTCRTLAYMLSKFEGNMLELVSPKSLRLGSDLKQHLEETGTRFREHKTLDHLLPEVDVVYMTRVQKERMDNALAAKAVESQFVLTNAHVERMNEHAIVMHPLPRDSRNPEILEEVDKNPRAKYFEQVGNGVIIRMALLKMMNEGPRL